MKANPTDWLLEEDNPSVRYFTLIDILTRSLNDAEVINAKQKIVEKGTVPKILDKEEGGGYWFFYAYQFQNRRRQA